MDHIDNLRERVEALEDHSRRVERRMRWWRGIACSAVMLGLSSWALPSSTAQTAKQEYSTGVLAQRLAALEYKLVHVTGGTNEVVITGANLRIVNGLGSTETTNGFGNLIVGYNEVRSPGDVELVGPDDRTGSHNVVVGALNNFSRFGGVVFGRTNSISGAYASVSGGAFNTASGTASSVSGGLSNIASEGVASVSGGKVNTASGDGASITGGSNNTASDEVSSVSGGSSNRAIGPHSSVSGGSSNTARNFGSSVSGGFQNTASGGNSSVSGGHNRSAPGQFSWAAGALFLDDF